MVKMMKPATTVRATAISGDRIVISREGSGRRTSSRRMMRLPRPMSRMGAIMTMVHAAHQQPDLIRRHRLCREGGRQLSVGKDGDPIGDLENFVKVLADHQHRRPAPCEVDKRLTDGARRACVDTPSRLAHNEDAGRAVDLPP